MATPTKPPTRSAIRGPIAAVLAMGLFLTACGGSATVTPTGTADDATGEAQPTLDPVEPTAVATEPTATEATAGDDPGDTSPDDGDDATAANPEPTSPPDDATAASPEPTSPPDDATAATPEPIPTPDLERVDFAADHVLAISPDGRFAYAGTTSPWNDETACGVPSFESVALLPIIGAVDGDEIAGYAAGLLQAGDVRQMLVGPDSSVALVSSCGPYDDATVWIQKGEIEADGTITVVGEAFTVGAPGESDPYLLQWIDGDTVEFRVIIEDDPDDYETWVVEHRQISMTTGEPGPVQEFGYLDDDAFDINSSFTIEGGFTYRVIPDPAGSLGCEGFGVGRTIELVGADGAGQGAFVGPQRVFSNVDGLHTSGDLISWTSGCEGYVTAYVGLVQDDGRIVDAHFVDVYSLQEGVDNYADFYDYRLTSDGYLVGVGNSYDPDTGEVQLEFLRYDLATDPNFVNTAEPPVEIDAEPLFEAIQPGAAWYVGETLGQERACGGRTLYANIDGAYLRAFPAGTELDEIVDVDLSEITVVEYDQGDDYVSRTVVVQTECSGEYDGRRVWYGIETDQAVWGLTFQQADLGEVADVLSVRDVLDESGQYVDRTIAEVQLFDGSTVEVELVAVPFD